MSIILFWGCFMSNFHISSNGQPSPCTAKPGNCPLKEDDGQPMPHFENTNDAYVYIEKLMKLNLD